MSQFILFHGGPGVSVPDGMEAVAVERCDALVEQVAARYFPRADAVYLLTDLDGGAESLVDQIWEGHRLCIPVLSTRLGQFLCDLYENQRSFVMWCGDDYNKLNAVASKAHLASELEAQTAAQPAEVWLAYIAEQP